MPVRSALFFALLLPWAAHAGPVIEHWQTGNGARVYFVAAPELPIVDVQIVFDAGSARDGNKYGVAQLTGTLLADGAKTAAGELSADAIAEHFAALGVQFGVGVQRDMATLSLRSLTQPDILQPALETLSLLVRQPTFPLDAFERERKRTLIGLQSLDQSPEALAEKNFSTALYGNHPYATQPLGTLESLNQLTRADVLAHHTQYYVARNAVVAIVGALDRKAAEALAEGVVGRLAEGARPASLPEVGALPSAQTLTFAHSSVQTHILMGQPGISRHDADYFPLLVGNHILGGNGLVSRLSDELREKRGLSYSVYSYFQPLQMQGPYTLGLQTRNQQAANALQVMRDTLQSFVNDGPTAQELTAARQNITGGFALRIDSNSKLANYLAVIGFYELPLDYLDSYTQKVEAVTLAHIKDAFGRRIKPAQMVTVIVGGKTESTAPTPN